jgi:tRNA(Ile)-lysidine synthase
MTTTSESAAHSVQQFFSTNHISSDDTILVAFSGGADSLALLILLTQVLPIDHLAALYVNHRLRDPDELAAEEKLNQRNCELLGVPLYIERLDESAVAECARQRGNGIEEAARVLRYAVLEAKQRALGYTYIATAHTLDDQSETILMRLLQGASILSLQGIAEKRDAIIRPVLHLTRSDIESVVREKQMQWVEDSTNSDTRYLRNGIRHTLVPQISKLFPQYRESLQQAALQAQAFASLITPQIHEAEAAITQHPDGGVLLYIPRLQTVNRLVVEQVIYAAWSRLVETEGKRLPYRTVCSVYEAIMNPAGEGDSVSLHRTRLERMHDHLWWRIEDEVLAESYVSFVYSTRTELDGERQLIVGPTIEGSVPVDQRARLDQQTLVPPLIARSFCDGDVIELVEGTKKVRALFADWHLKRSDRWRVPVLEDRMGIVAVLGGAYGGRDRVSTRCRIATLAPNSGTLYSVTDREG